MNGKRYLWVGLVLLQAVRVSAAEPAPLSALSGLWGTVTVGNAQWQRLDLQPHFRMGPLEAVLDLELFLDETGRVRDLGWDFSSRRRALESVLRKIHWIRYGNLNDPKRRVYVRVGDLEDVTLGQGLIMRHYRNTLYAPGKKETGLDFQVRGLADGRMSVRAVVSNLLDLDGGGPVVGGRVATQPGGGVEFGATLVVDTDQLSGLPDSLRAGRGRDAYGVFGLDATYPLLTGPRAHVALYGGMARPILGAAPRGIGVGGPGILVRVGGLTLQGEYRWVKGPFEPGYFDALYDLNRARFDPKTGRVVTGEAALGDLSMQGLFGSCTLSFGSLLEADATYQRLDGSGGKDQRLEGRATLLPRLLQQLPRVSRAEVFYENHRRGTDGTGFFKASSGTRFGYRLGLEPVPHLSVVLEVQFTYEPDGAGGFRRVRTLNFQSVVGL